MNLPLRALALFVFLVSAICRGGPSPAATPAAAVDPLVIHYTSGFREIEVKASTFRCVWWTEKKLPPGPSTFRQSEENYDRHEFSGPLTAVQVDAFRQWAQRHRVFAMPRELPIDLRYSRGTVKLKVEDGREAWSGEWTSSTKALGAAVEELKAIAEKLAGDEG